MTIIWEASDGNWRERYGIDDELADRLADLQDRGFDALENGPSSDAVRCFATLVDRWVRIAGLRDDTTMVQRAFLARALAADGQALMAAEELRRLVVDRTVVLGPDDPQTLRTRGQLGQVLARNGHADAGIEIDLVLLDDRIRLYGPDDPATFDTMGNLAEAYLNAGRVVEGRDLYAELLERRTRVLGPDDPATVRTAENLAVAQRRCAWDADRRERR